MPNNETKVLDEDGAILLTSNIKTLADATYPANAAMAQSYSTSSSYSIGEYCLHNGLFYRCTTTIPSGGEVWTAAHWVQANTGSELNAKENRKLQFTDVVVNTSSFVADETYDNYPWRVAIPLTGVTISMYPEVVLNSDEATSGLFSPVSQSYNGGVYLYVSELPHKNFFIIPNILLWPRDINTGTVGELNVADEIQAIEDDVDDLQSDVVDLQSAVVDLQNGLVLLWTNPNSRTSFAAQTVNINLTDYDLILIFYYSHNADTLNDPCAVISAILLKDYTNGLYTGSPNSGSNTGRKVTVSNSGIVFENCIHNGSTGNTHCVPICAYGIKTGITS